MILINFENFSEKLVGIRMKFWHSLLMWLMSIWFSHSDEENVWMRFNSWGLYNISTARTKWFNTGLVSEVLAKSELSQFWCISFFYCSLLLGQLSCSLCLGYSLWNVMIRRKFNTCLQNWSSCRMFGFKARLPDKNYSLLLVFLYLKIFIFVIH